MCPLFATVRNPTAEMSTLCYFYFLLAVGFAHAVTVKELGTIFLRLYTSNDVSPYVDVPLSSARKLMSYVDGQKNTVFYIHGFTESVNSTSIKVVVDAYLARKDHNVVVVDWSKLAGENYLRVSMSVDEVGVAVARAIRDMVESGLDSKRIHVVAHSMGAHVAGAVGRNTSPPLPRITGLDPAGPLFQLIRKRLSPTDAAFVDVIHTDAGFYGVARESGAVDFWPNKGRRIQPGCPLQYKFLSEEDFCSHHRSWYFYAESLLNVTAFLAVKCAANSSPSTPEVIPMGYATPLMARGSYCLVTSDTAPFGWQEAGALEV